MRPILRSRAQPPKTRNGAPRTCRPRDPATSPGKVGPSRRPLPQHPRQGLPTPAWARSKFVSSSSASRAMLSRLRGAGISPDPSANTSSPSTASTSTAIEPAVHFPSRISSESGSSSRRWIARRSGRAPKVVSVPSLAMSRQAASVRLMDMFWAIMRSRRSDTMRPTVLTYLVLGEGLEYDDLVDAVQKLGSEQLLHLGHHAALDFLVRKPAMLLGREPQRVGLRRSRGRPRWRS